MNSRKDDPKRKPEDYDEHIRNVIAADTMRYLHFNGN